MKIIKRNPDPMEEKVSGIMELATQAFETATLGHYMDGAYAHLPITWSPRGDGHGNPPVTDPLTIYFCLAANGDDPDFILSIPLRELVTEVLDCNVILGGERKGQFSESKRDILATLSEALRDEANRIDHAIKHGYQGDA